MNIEAISIEKKRLHISMAAFEGPLWAISAFVLARAALMGGLYPFGAAMLCVLYKERKAFYWALIGLALGGISLLPSLYGAALYVLPYLVLVPLLKFLLLRNREKLIWRLGAIVAAYGITALCVPLLAYDLLMLAFSAIAAIALTNVLEKVYLLSFNFKNRTILQKDELLCINLLICALLTSLPMGNIWVIRPIIMLSCLYIGLGARAFGVGGGAGCGMALALLWLLRGGDSTTALCLASGGLLAGVLRDWWRLGVPLGFMLGDLIITLYFTREPAFSLGLVNVLIGLTPIVLMPKKLTARMLTLAGSLSGVSEKTTAYIERLHMRQSEKILEASSMFSQLSRVFLENAGADKRSLRVKLVSLTAKEICEACPQYDYCWSSRYSDTYSEIRLAAENVLRTGKISEMPASLHARCNKSAELATKMNSLYKQLEMAKPEPVERGISMASQCKSVSDMLFEFSENLEKLPDFDHELEQNLMFELDKKGIHIQEIICEKEKGARVRISIKMPACKGSKDCKRRLENELLSLTGKRFCCISNTCASAKESCNSVYTSMPRLSVSAFGAREKKKGQSVCGDSYSLMQLHDGRYIAAISDGAGSGETAARESEGALDLLETLCSGSMRAKELFSTMNELLLLRSRGDGYSTVDVVEIDLDEGLAEWTKIGAVPGYIVRGKRVERIDAGALPMGILKNIQPVVVKKLLRSGDIIVLVSDGIYDSLCPSGEDGISAYLSEQSEENPQKLAEGLLQKALSLCGGTARDDMTAAALRVFE